MRKELINLEMMNNENIKRAIDTNNNNICKFVVEITRGIAEYVKSGFSQINKKINEDNENLDVNINNTLNEVNDLWRYVNENVYGEFKRLKDGIENEKEISRNKENLTEELVKEIESLKKEIKVIKETESNNINEIKRLKKELNDAKDRSK